jgi:stage V sporulation protein K
MEETRHRIHVVFEQSSKKIQVEDDPKLLTPDHVPLQKCLERLHRLIGLKHVKTFVKEIYAWLQIGKKRQEAGLSADSQVLHMVFTGNPGTGKTTVARILSELFKEMGVLSKGHLIEVERADLVGEYIGHTAQKTREHIKRALGGILFIDEAYSLARGGEKDFGKEAIDTMVKSMEDYKNDFVLILAGYSDEMDRFLRLNPGLPSRFPIHLSFPDFTVEELMQIADQMAEERQYRLSVGAKEKLRRHLEKEQENADRPFGNARYVRNLIEQAIRHQAVRLLNMRKVNREDLMTIRSEDFQWERISSASWYNKLDPSRSFRF